MTQAERRWQRVLTEVGERLSAQTGIGIDGGFQLLKMALAWRMLAEAGAPVQGETWSERWELARSWGGEIFAYPQEWDTELPPCSELLDPLISQPSPIAHEQTLALIHQLALDRQGEGRARARRSKGSYYTPTAIVDQLLAGSLDQWIGAWRSRWSAADLDDQGPLRAELAQLRVLDPACGAGAFLLAAWERLTVCWQMTGDSYPAWSALRNLSGWEQDPGAVAILRVTIAARLCAARGPQHHIHLDVTIGDFLQHLPSDVEKVDLIVGNPPWVRAKYAVHGPADQRQERLRALREQFPELAVGELNLYTLFISRALDWLQPGGRLAFITPSSFLLDRNSEGLRRRLLTSYRIGRLTVLTEQEGRRLFGGISQASVMLTVEHATPATDGDSCGMDHKRWLQLPYALIAAGSPVELNLLQRMLDYPSLAERFTIQDGELHLTRGRGWIEEQVAEGLLPLVRGVDLSRSNATAQSYVRLDESVREQWSELIAGRRILLQRIANQHRTRRLKGAIVCGVVAGNSTVALIPKDEAADRLLSETLKLLHSDLYQWLLMKLSSDNNIPAWKLKLLPWLPPTALEVETANTAINQLVYGLYGLSDDEQLMIANALSQTQNHAE